ncbi:MAG TPA: hypothetical protein DD473_09145 [Planctomycetaceae bacterium]|nr:hypothetical protein [Planctomycetaceae bacterium]
MDWCRVRKGEASVEWPVVRVFQMSDWGRSEAEPPEGLKAEGGKRKAEKGEIVTAVPKPRLSAFPFRLSIL